MKNHERIEQVVPMQLDIYQDGSIVEAVAHPAFQSVVQFVDNPLVESIAATDERLAFIKAHGLKRVRFNHDKRQIEAT